MMKRYFKAAVEDAHRIAVVETDDDTETAGYLWADEISPADLPPDFEEWLCYTRYATDDANTIVRVKSRHGD